MITVSISINGEPIFTRTAVNRGEVGDGEHLYVMDDGSTILHKRSSGAVPLAVEMLKRIKESCDE